MSVAVQAIPAPHSQVLSVNGRETEDITVSEKDEELDEKHDELENFESTCLTRVKPAKAYSKEDILSLRDSLLCKIKPASLSDKYCNRDGIWDPELWYYSPESEKRSASPIDPKKKYLFDGIVLSPQGRSFARGCQVPSGKSSGRRGRGWDPREKTGPGGRISPAGDGRYERNTRNERYEGTGRGRRRAGSYDSQPEWFTHGPSSQLDTIELKGFDEVEKGNRRKKRKKDVGEGKAGQVQLSADEMFDESTKFDINEFFDMAENALPISGMFENQITSRFSQWFNNERRSRSRSGSLNASYNNSQSNSRRSSIADELAEIAGLTLSSPVRTPTPDADFLFAPIVPASESCGEDTLLDVLQSSEIDVQPLLDSVIPHKTVKGAVNLADLEGEDDKLGEQDVKHENRRTEEEEEEEEEESAEAFLKLVETMKASGNLPEKPTPTIPDIPPHLLPRPPSSKDKKTISPIMRGSRSPSPLQLLQEAIRRGQSPVNFSDNARSLSPGINFVGGARTQSPLSFVADAQPPVTKTRVASPFDALRRGSPVSDLFPTPNVSRPLTPEELYGAPPAFNINSIAAGPELFEFSGSAGNVGAKLGAKRKQNLPRSSGPSLNSTAPKSTHAGYPVISQAFVPTSVLRKIHSDKHDPKSSEVPEVKQEKDLGDGDHRSLRDDHVASQGQRLFDVPSPLASSDSSQSLATDGRASLMSPDHFTSPKTTVEVKNEPIDRPELLTPHRLPLPVSPTTLTPHSLPLPASPLIQGTPRSSSSVSSKQQLLTPGSLPLPQSPLVNGLTSTSASGGTSNFGIRPLPKGPGIDDVQRAKTRSTANAQDVFKRPLDQSTRLSSSGNNTRRFLQGQVPFRGQLPVNPGMIRRPGLVPNPYNMNAANLGRSMNVHPTALALALRNQQYQMARAAAVAAATAAVNRPPVMSPAQAAAAALMLNQQRASATAALRGLMPQVNPRMFQQAPLRPNLPPALQHQHHVVHRSEPAKDNSLSKWFSDALLSQSQAQPAAPGRGAKVLSVEELERHA